MTDRPDNPPAMQAEGHWVRLLRAATLAQQLLARDHCPRGEWDDSTASEAFEQIQRAALAIRAADGTAPDNHRRDALLASRDALLSACEEARVHLTGTLRGLPMDAEHLARTLDAALELARRPL